MSVPLVGSASPAEGQHEGDHQCGHRQPEPLQRVAAMLVGGKGVGQYLEVAVVSDWQCRIQPQYTRRQPALEFGGRRDRLDVDAGEQPVALLVVYALAHRDTRGRRRRHQSRQGDGSLGSFDGRHRAIRRQGQPTEVDQQRPARSRLEYPVGPDTHPAAALLVVEQQRRRIRELAWAGSPFNATGTGGVGRDRQRVRAAVGHGCRRLGEHGFLVQRASRLPQAQRNEQCDAGDRQRPSCQQRCATAHADHPPGCDNARSPATVPDGADRCWSTLMKTLLIVGFLVLILWNLGAGLYYMLVDKGGSKRTVNALTRRIGLSIALIVLVVLAAKMGWIEFHGVGA